MGSPGHPCSEVLTSLGAENSPGPMDDVPEAGHHPSPTAWRGCVRGSTSRDQPFRPEVFLVVRVLPSKVWL